MKHIIILMTMIASLLIAENENRATIAVMDIMSTALAPAERITLSDLLTTELFRVRPFRIVERSVLRRILEEHQISMSGLTSDSAMLAAGKILAAQYLFVCTAEMFSQTMVVNVRIIDVNAMTIDYTENTVLAGGKLTMDAIKDIVKRIELYYLVRIENSVREGDDSLVRRWRELGADTNETAYLAAARKDTSEFLDLRQYDLSFRIANYVEACRSNWDTDVLKNFMQAGIPFSRARRALKNGITGISTYRTMFMPKGYSFDDYLDAYENHIVSPEKYTEFRQGYRTDRFVVGIGGIADSLPMANARFKFLLLNTGWEHFMTKYQRGAFKWSTEMGLNLMNGYVPVPYAQASIYLGSFPYYAKASIGGHAELFLGGHAALFARFGMEFFEFLEYNVTIAFLGNQPHKSYADLSRTEGTPGYVGIQFPYFGAFITAKF